MTKRIDFRALWDHNVSPMKIGKGLPARVCMLTALALSRLSAEGSELRISSFPPVKASVSGLRMEGDITHLYFDEGVFDYDARLSPYYHAQDDTTELNLGLALAFAHENESWAWKRYHASVGPSFELRKYLLRSAFFIQNSISMGLDEFYRTDTFPHRWERDLRGRVDVGVGYGRVREGTYVATALQVNKILRGQGVTESDLSRQTVLGIAQAIARGSFFHMRAHDRYHKYLLEAIEDVLNQDPACQGRVIPAYVWVKILEIVGDEARYFYGTGQSDHWRRFFGSRFSINLLASDISYQEQDYQGGHLNLFDSLDYLPALEVRYEFHWPRTLNTQLSLLPLYHLEFRRGEKQQWVLIESSYGYGLIDHLLLEGGFRTSYSVKNGDTISTSAELNLSPGVVLTYYLEESIEFRLEAGNPFSIRWLEGEWDGHLYGNPFLDLSVDWRIL